MLDCHKGYTKKSLSNLIKTCLCATEVLIKSRRNKKGETGKTEREDKLEIEANRGLANWQKNVGRLT